MDIFSKSDNNQANTLPHSPVAGHLNVGADLDRGQSQLALYVEQQHLLGLLIEVTLVQQGGLAVTAGDGHVSRTGERAVVVTPLIS